VNDTSSDYRFPSQRKIYYYFCYAELHVSRQDHELRCPLKVASVRGPLWVGSGALDPLVIGSAGDSLYRGLRTSISPV